MSDLHSAVRLWDVETGKEIQTLTEKSEWHGSARMLRSHPDGLMLAAGETVRVWATRTGRVATCFGERDSAVGYVNAVAVDAAGRVLALATRTDNAQTQPHLWDVEQRPLVSLPKQMNGNSAAVCPHTRRIAGLAPDGVLIIWDGHVRPAPLTVGPI